MTPSLEEEPCNSFSQVLGAPWVRPDEAPATMCLCGWSWQLHKAAHGGPDRLQRTRLCLIDVQDQLDGLIPPLRGGSLERRLLAERDRYLAELATEGDPR